MKIDTVFLIGAISEAVISLSSLAGVIYGLVVDDYIWLIMLVPVLLAGALSYKMIKDGKDTYRRWHS
jgi:hypothetical protein